MEKDKGAKLLEPPKQPLLAPNQMEASQYILASRCNIWIVTVSNLALDLSELVVIRLEPNEATRPTPRRIGVDHPSGGSVFVLVLVCPFWLRSSVWCWKWPYSRFIAKFNITDQG